MPQSQTSSLLDESSYGVGAKLFHWAVALLLIWVGVLGLLHDSWPKHTQAFWINIHALSGLTLWILVIARFAWRIAHPSPPLPPNIDAVYRHLSRAAHFSLYVLLIVIPIVGVVTFIWHGRVFDFGLFKLNVGVPSNRAVFEPTEDLHGYLAYALFALAGIHILAALWHQFIKHDRILQRMLP